MKQHGDRAGLLNPLGATWDQHNNKQNLQLGSSVCQLAAIAVATGWDGSHRATRAPSHRSEVGRSAVSHFRGSAQSWTTKHHHDGSGASLEAARYLPGCSASNL